MIAVLGCLTLTALTFAPRGRLVAALVPPWGAGGFGAAAATGLAVVDLRWAGHVMILDTGGNPAALRRLWAQGYWVMDAGGTQGCGDKGRAK